MSISQFLGEEELKTTISSSVSSSSYKWVMPPDPAAAVREKEQQIESHKAYLARRAGERQSPAVAVRKSRFFFRGQKAGYSLLQPEK